MRRLIFAGIFTAALYLDGTAFAWGDQGHEIVAEIAYKHLTPKAKATVDALLAADRDNLTAPDVMARGTWADKYRDVNNRQTNYIETQAWHFVDIELTAPDISTACFSFPGLPQGAFASGPPAPADDCAANKIVEFERELESNATPQPERMMALKFILHFVGDIHQPLHASDDHDRGGNCEQIRLRDGGRKEPLHHYWDTDTVDAIIANDKAMYPSDSTLRAVADRLALASIAQPAPSWSPTDVNYWAMESFGVAQAKGYNLPPHAACDPSKRSSEYPAFTLPDTYQAAAIDAAQTQLERAGGRLATILNFALR